MTTHKQPPPSIFLRKWRLNTMRWTQDEAFPHFEVFKRTYQNWENGGKVRQWVIDKANKLAKEQGK